MLKALSFVMINISIIFVCEVVQAAEEAVFSVRERQKASLYQMEGGGVYFFAAHEDISLYHTANSSISRVALDGPYVGKNARLFKGPIDDLKELFVCSTGITSTGSFHIITREGTFSVDKKQWEDPYENVFNLIHMKKENNDDLFSRIVLKGQALKSTPSEKLERAGLSPTTDLTPKSRLYRVERLNKYFFVGYNKATYYEDESGNYKSSTPNMHTPISREGYTARVFFGEYPQLNEVLSSDYFYPGQSSLFGPYHLIGLPADCLYSSLNLMKNQWTYGNNVVYKLVHIKKQDNEEFYKKIKLVSKK